MARSQQSFQKKENEKKKQQKKQDKEKRKEDRKAGQGKGQSLDSMLAYVDEYGNLSPTPPPPRKPDSIRAEDIAIGVPRREEVAEDPIRRGIVTNFDKAKGYGFIRDQQSQASVFVHMTGLKTPIQERDQVTFRVEAGEKGPKAVDVTKV